MAQADNAAFNFSTFKISEFSYHEIDSDQVSLKLNFDPSGLFDEKKGVYYLTLDFRAFDFVDNNEVDICKLKIIGTFEFENSLSLNEIPDYFYASALAILFPYTRSFLSSLTLQANARMLILDLLNLTTLGSLLKDNTSLIKS